MLDVTYTYTGYNRVRNQLRAAASFHRQEADPIVEKHTKNEAGKLRNKPYAPKLPNQRYQRTFRMGKAFRAQRQGVAQWAVINRVKSLKYGRPYAAWVIKRGMQARVHRNRWWVMDDELDKSVPMLTRNLTIMLEDLLNRQRD